MSTKQTFGDFVLAYYRSGHFIAGISDDFRADAEQRRFPEKLDSFDDLLMHMKRRNEDEGGAGRIAGPERREAKVLWFYFTHPQERAA